MFIGEMIGEQYKEWGKTSERIRGGWNDEMYSDNVVFISASTGAGKTTFILKTFADFVVHAKGERVLILVSRKILQEQLQRICMDFFAIKQDLQKYAQNICVSTYQAVEKLLLQGGEVDDFQVVICDEAHYFIEDSLFNVQTQISFNWLCDFISRKKRLAVFLSATIEEFKQTLISTLELEPVKMEMVPKKAGKVKVSFVRQREYYGRYYAYDFVREPLDSKITVRYLVSNQEAVDVLKSAGGKRIYFLSNKDRAKDILQQLMTGNVKVSFVSAENKDGDGKEVVSSLVQDNKFSADVLLATSVLDVGVNIEDREVTTIILDTCSRTAFLQMLGRVRLKKGQPITIYIFKRDVNYFQNWLKTIRPRLQFQMDLAHVQDKNVPSKIVSKWMQDGAFVDMDVIYFLKGKLQLNKLVEIKLKSQLVGLNDAMQGLQADEEYFIKKQLHWLGLEDTFSEQNYASIANKKQRREEVIAAIRKKCMSSSKKGLGKEEVSKILQKVKEDVRSLDKQFLRSNENLSVDKFRRICKNEQLPFYIVQTTVDRKQVYWLVDLSNDENQSTDA